jgi:hypothetical protein
MSQSPFVEPRLLPNPFVSLVGDPLEDSEVDVSEINEKAFLSCQRLVQDVLEARVSGALTLYGEAGTGKTHLLGRMRKWLGSRPGSLFVLARMDTNARMLWRHLRRCLAEALLRPSASGHRALDDLLSSRRAALDQLPERDLGIVLENLLNGTHLRDAAAWLRGQELPEAGLQRLELSQPGPEDSQEIASRNVIVSLCSLIEPGAVVFCLDQMEALQSFVRDTDGIHAAGQAISLLHDPPVRNACMICCVQTGCVKDLENVLDEPTRDRMLGRRDYIRPLDWEQAQRLIEARLSSLPALTELRLGQQNPHWPLSAQTIRQVFTDNAAPARKVISRCKDLFDEWRTGEIAPPEPLDAALRTMLDERISPVEAADAEAAFRDGLPLLLRSLGASVTIPNSRSPFDFSLNNGEKIIALCNQVDGRSFAPRLRKIAEAWNPSGQQRLLLLRDARLTVGANAKATRQRLQSIEEQGGRLVAVSQEAVEALAALRRLLADAESGDLAYHGDSVSPATVEQWIAGHLPAALEPLVDQLQAAAAVQTGTPDIPSPDLLSPRLAALLAQSKIVSLEDAARELQAQPEEVESCARRDPRLFGILGGATPALFQPVRAD